MNEINSTHSFCSKGREGMTLEGVSDVVSFDEGGVVMETLCGSLAVEGEGLHVTVLNLTDGKVVIEGRINSLYYFEATPKQKKGLFGKRE